LFPIDADRICRETFVAAVEAHDELPSTNNLALELAGRDDVPCPLLVVAKRQTAGRGRGHNAWWSSDGALTFSLLLDTSRLELRQASWPQASLATGLAVFEALREFAPGEPFGLKWPNDVFLRQRKVCGVLVESPQPAGGRLVVGVGINVNNSFDAAPDDVRWRAISLLDAAGSEFGLTDVLVGVLRSLEGCYRDVAARPRQLAERWRAACILRGRSVRINLGSRLVEGSCLGIDEQGALVVQTGEGPERCFGGIVESFDP
jgi:BirA family biotin operon repressor/biotin-[acetyl-CoA-carboxylase] ligase